MSDYISESTLIHILKYLPVRSLVRFRSVCKWWKELVDSEEIMQAHLAVQKPRFFFNCFVEPKLFAVELCNPPLVHTLTSPFERQAFSVIGTLHGVVCLLIDDYHSFLLWNPCVRKFSTIPLGVEIYACIIKSWKCCGFWIDPYTKEFKIIVLLFSLLPDGYGFGRHVEVTGILYSSILRAALPLGLELDRDWAPFSYNGDPAQMIAGVAHWKGNRNFLADKATAILCFDFTQHSLELIDMPCDGEIIQWKGTLSVLHWHNTFPHTCEIYMRREGSWINMFSFNICSPDTAEFSVLMLD